MCFLFSSQFVRTNKFQFSNILKKGIIDKKTRKINKFKNKINQQYSSEQEFIRPKSDNGSENSQKSSFHEQNQVSEYYSIDPEANAYQFNKKWKKNAEVNSIKSSNQEKNDQQFLGEEENIENFDWSILEDQKFSSEKQNIPDHELTQRKQQQIDNQPQEINAQFMEKMWKYGIDKLCHSIESIANRSTKLQKLLYVSFRSMMQTIQIINHNKRQSHVNFPSKSDNMCYLVTNSKSLGNNNPYTYPQQKNQINKYEVMLKKSQIEQQEKLIQIQRHIKDLKNQRKKLTESLNLTRKRCRYSQENRNFSKQYQKSIQGSEQQMIRGKNRNRYDRGIQMQDEENYKRGNMIKSLYRNNRLKQSTKANKQIEKDKSLSASQNGQVWKQKEIFQSSGEEQIQFNDIIQEFAVGPQLEKSQQIQSVNANLNSLSSEAQKQRIKIENESANNDNMTALIPRQIKPEDRRQIKIENTTNKKVKLEEEGLGFKDKMLKKLEALKRDSELTKLKRQQQAQQNIQRIAKAKQERQKKANQTEYKKQNGISRANKQMLLIKHINKSSAVKYKRVEYYFSEIDKHLQLSVMDRDTANSLSDDNHQKIITISPQLDHEYSLHRVHLRIVNVEYWVAIGICDIDQVKKNRCIMKVRQFGHHGVYMLGSNGLCYSNYIEEDHRIDKGFKFKNGDIIRVNVDSTNCLISFVKNKGGPDAQKYSMKYNPHLQLCKIRFCVGLCRTKDIIRIQNCKNPFLQ